MLWNDAKQTLGISHIYNGAPQRDADVPAELASVWACFCDSFDAEMDNIDCPHTAYDVATKNARTIHGKLFGRDGKPLGNCPRCGGSGFVRSTVANGVCFKCHGRGSV